MSVTVWPFEPGHEAVAVDWDPDELDVIIAELAVDWPPICDEIEDVVEAELLLASMPPIYPGESPVNVGCPSLK